MAFENLFFYVLKLMHESKTLQALGTVKALSKNEAKAIFFENQKVPSPTWVL